MLFRYNIEIEVEHVQGKFASHNEVAELLEEALTNADKGRWTSEEGVREYETTRWEVRESLKTKETSKGWPG